MSKRMLGITWGCSIVIVILVCYWLCCWLWCVPTIDTTNCDEYCEENCEELCGDIEGPPGPVIVIDQGPSGSESTSIYQWYESGTSTVFTGSGSGSTQIREDFAGTDVLQMVCVSGGTEYDADAIEATSGTNEMRLEISSVGIHWFRRAAGATAWTAMLPTTAGVGSTTVPDEFLDLNRGTMKMTAPTARDCDGAKFQIKKPHP